MEYKRGMILSRNEEILEFVYTFGRAKKMVKSGIKVFSESLIVFCVRFVIL